MRSLQGDQSPETARDGAGNLPMELPEASTPPDAPTVMFPTEAAFPAPAEGNPDAMADVDPFALWAATSGKPQIPPPASNPRARPRPAQQDRRKFVKLLAVGTAGLVTMVTVGGISFARAPQNTTKSPPRTDDDRSDGSTSIDAHKERDDGGRGGERDDGDWGRRGRRPHQTPTPSNSPTPRPSPSPTQTPRPSPTSQPTMTPTPAGKVIGSTSQATNSAVSFNNPADGQASWLVRMSNGNFVAVEQACTHAGVAVKYNASTGQFNCPAHGAIFNADGTNPQAPATRPLPPVHITVNANGTITTP